MFGYLKISKEEYENLHKTLKALLSDNPTTCPKVFIYPDVNEGQSHGLAFQFMIDSEALLSPILRTYKSSIELSN